MKILATTAIAALALAGTASAETRNLSGFDSVGAEGHFRVEVAMGNAFSVTVDGAEADKVETYIRNHSLQIRQTGTNWFRGSRRIDAVVHVTMPRVEGLSSAKGAEMRATDIRANDLSLSVAMGSEMVVTGTCHSLSASAAMGAELNAAHLDCATVDVSASMGAEADVFARESVSASASMGADIDISGNPRSRSASASMGGDISYP